MSNPHASAGEAAQARNFEENYPPRPVPAVCSEVRVLNEAPRYYNATPQIRWIGDYLCQLWTPGASQFLCQPEWVVVPEFTRQGERLQPRRRANPQNSPFNEPQSHNHPAE